MRELYEDTKIDNITLSRKKKRKNLTNLVRL